ncbi:MAG: caspase family protein [Deltaproteobacteria bacterium]|nr:caspase family protein [Deltaproteobacteria bacterium]
MPEPSSFYVSIAMHGDAAFVARGTDVSAWDLQTLERRWIRHDGLSSGTPEDAVVSPDGRTLTVESATKNTTASMLATKTRTFDVATGALVAEGQRPGNRRAVGLAARVESPDGQWVISVAEKSRIAELRKLEPMKDGKDLGPVVRTFQLAQPPGAEDVFRWTRHGFVSSTAGTLQFWTVTSNKPVATHAIGSEGPATLRVALSPDTNTVAITYVGTTLQLFDAATGVRLRSSSLAKLGYVRDLAIGNDRTWALVVIEGTPIAINLVRDASVRLFEYENQWAIVDSDGVFTASAGAGSLLAAVRGRRGFRIDQLALRNNDPARLMRALGVGSDEQRAYYDHAYRTRLQRAGVDAAAVGDMFESIPTVEFASATQDRDHVDIELDLEAPRGLLRYNIDVNGVPVFGSQGKPVSGKRQRVTERIQLGRDMNRVELRVTDSAGREGLRPVRQFEAAATGKSELYFLGFGVSDYANAAYRLAFARKDTLDLAAALQHASSAFARVHTRVYVDAAVTPDRIRAAKEFVAGAGVDDVVIVMIAGHGIHASDKAARYYFVTHGTDNGRLAETAAPFEDIESLVDGIRSRRKLFLIDTCESGERDPTETVAITRAADRGLTARTLKRVAATTAPAPRRFVLERDNFLFNGILRSSGTVVFSSSRGAELSYETEELRNGVFTQAVLEAFTEDTADSNGDGRITTAELRAYVAKDVADYTQGAQNPTIDRDNLAADIAIPKLSGARSIVARADAPQPDYVVANLAKVEAPQLPTSVRTARGCCESGDAGSGVLGLALIAWVTRRRRLLTRT